MAAHTGWTAKEIHQAVLTKVLTAFHLSEADYGLNQLRYDLRKLKGHALLERDGTRYAYRLTQKRIEVASLFLFFHKRLCAPLANSRFHHQPDPRHRPDSRLEAAYHRADKAIEDIVGLLAALDTTVTADQRQIPRRTFTSCCRIAASLARVSLRTDQEPSKRLDLPIAAENSHHSYHSLPP
jgi:hypothetical protein